jgi:hypothetical protein
MSTSDANMSHDGSDAYTGDQFAPDTSKKDLLRQERVKAKNRYVFFNQHFPQWCAASSTPFTICRRSLIPSVIQHFAVQFCAAESKHSSLPCCRRAQKKYREKKLQEVDLYKVQVGGRGQQQDLMGASKPLSSKQWDFVHINGPSMSACMRRSRSSMQK